VKAHERRLNRNSKWTMFGDFIADLDHPNVASRGWIRSSPSESSDAPLRVGAEKS